MAGVSKKDPNRIKVVNKSGYVAQKEEKKMNKKTNMPWNLSI